MDGFLGANAATLNSFDSIDGGAGTDTLNLIALNGVHVAVPTGASVKNIEIINILNKGNSTVDASAFIGAREVWRSETSAAISGLANGVVAGFNGVRARHATYDDDATSAAIQLDNANAGSTVRISGDGLTDASISGSVDGGNLAINLTTNTADAELTTLTLALDKSGVVTFNGVGVFTPGTVDASGSKGGLTVNAVSGNDTLALKSIVGG